jgi:hypothetical protein
VSRGHLPSKGLPPSDTVGRVVEVETLRKNIVKRNSLG